MIISLHERTEAHVRVYFRRTQDREIRQMLPSAAHSEEAALAMFRRTLEEQADSYGRIICVDGEYVGDVWCYGIQHEETPHAMLSYCIFDKARWGQGVATEAVRLFLAQAGARFGLESVGAFAYADNAASLRVLEKNGFRCVEQFTEEGRLSAYWEKGPL